MKTIPSTEHHQNDLQQDTTGPVINLSPDESQYTAI
jgi:hypothetical protein